MSPSRKKNMSVPEGDGKEFFYLLKGVFLALLILPAVLALFCVLCRAVYASQNTVDLCSASAFALCSFFAALVVSKKISKSGLFKGALLGLGFFLILFFLSLVFRKRNAFSLYMLLKGTLSVLGGAFGGILGINSKKHLPRR